MGPTTKAQSIALGVLIALAAAAVTAIALTAKQASGAPVASPPVVLAPVVTPGQDTLTVVGQGSASAKPDQANLNLGVSATRGSVKEAVNVATDDANRLLKALHDQGVQDKDIRTTALSIRQEQNCCPRVDLGFSASTQYDVLIRHVANVGDVIGAATVAVGNDIQLNGVWLSVSDAASPAKSARAAAMADAGARAKEWSGLSGRHLGRIRSVSEVIQGAGQPLPCQGCGGGGGGAFGVQGGQSTLAVTITVVYELLDHE